MEPRQHGARARRGAGCKRVLTCPPCSCTLAPDGAAIAWRVGIACSWQACAHASGKRVWARGRGQWRGGGDKEGSCGAWGGGGGQSVVCHAWCGVQVRKEAMKTGRQAGGIGCKAGEGSRRAALRNVAGQSKGESGVLEERGEMGRLLGLGPLCPATCAHQAAGQMCSERARQATSHCPARCRWGGGGAAHVQRVRCISPQPQPTSTPVNTKST